MTVGVETVEFDGTNGGLTYEVSGVALAAGGELIDDFGPVPAPVPADLQAHSITRTSAILTWDDVPHAVRYRVEYRDAATGEWITATESATETAHTASGLTCGTSYLFRVSAYGNGIFHTADWGAASEELRRDTAACNVAPVFGYRFFVTEDAAPGHVVGKVVATDLDHDALTYSITSGNESGQFAIGGDGVITTVAGALDYASQGCHTLVVAIDDGHHGGATAPVMVVVSEAPAGSSENPDGVTPIDLGPGLHYISPELWGLLQRHANGETVRGYVTLSLGVGWFDASYEENASELAEYITCVGGRKIDEGVWDIPTAHTLWAIQRPYIFAAVLEGDGNFDHPQLNDTLDDIANAYAEGILAERAAQYALFIRGGSVVVSIRTPGDPTIETLRDWLTARDVHVLPRDTEGGGYYGHVLVVLLPVEHISTLVAEFVTVYLRAADLQSLPLDRSLWSPESREFEDGVVSQYLPPADGAAESSNSNSSHP